MKFSLNNKLIVEPYLSDRAITASAEPGFLRIQQRVSLVGLKLLVESKLNLSGNIISLSEGSKIYIKEHTLHTSSWSKMLYESDAIAGKFILVDLADVEFVETETTGTWGHT